MNSDGGGNVGIVEDELDALKQYQPESEVVTNRGVVFEDVTLRSIPPRHARTAAAAGRRSPDAATATPSPMKRRALGRKSQLSPTLRRLGAHAVAAAGRSAA